MTDIQFTINQLRTDKIVYAVEACAVNLTCILVFTFAQLYQEGLLREIVTLSTLLIAIGYTLYMAFTNLIRLKKIQVLEKELQGKTIGDTV